MKRRQRLGQHFLEDPRYLRPIVAQAGITSGDAVLEAGTGHGSLTELLCATGAHVVSYELDRNLFEAVRRRLRHLSNLDLRRGDAFASKTPFTIFVSNLPFAASSRFLDWLVARPLRRAVVTVQREYATKLQAPPADAMYRAVSAVAQVRFRMTEILQLPRAVFRPPPRVSATLLLFEPRRPPIPRRVVVAVKRLFAYRGRKLRSALRDLLPDGPLTTELLMSSLDLRVELLAPDRALLIAETIAAHPRARAQ
jgi:16S rRNA A1518/A1519 N6-dimethyltransferase RsmA/KsgA/DIM1 with predicted DNA glycosylase/AP lyase activity